MIAKTSYEKGRDYEQCRILKRQLLKRFGDVSDSVWTKIEGMSCEQREQLAADLVTATSLEQVGLVVGDPDPRVRRHG